MASSRSFYAASVSDFLEEDVDRIVGRMSLRLAEMHNQAERSQLLAWQSELEILKASFREIGTACQDWSILLETPILRLGRRMDAVILMPGVVCVVEFKIGASSFGTADIRQTAYYALCLRDFHAASQVRTVVPVLCAENAKHTPVGPLIVDDGVANVLKANSQTLAEALRMAARYPGQDKRPLSNEAFDFADYRPTPNIIEAARSLYSGHSVAEIGRGDAAAQDLQASSDRLEALVQSARNDRKKIICFVTGTPGAGKTLLGLNLALRSRVAGSELPPASLLSGNPPLVHVLVEALAEDAHQYRGVPKPKARHEAATAIQGLLGFLRQHSDGSAPPERVIVFDEAQRAWDAEVGQKLLGRKRSEPSLFLDIMGQSEWAALICLVGPGQEINRGEGGMALWGEALEDAAAEGQSWEVWSAPDVVDLDGQAWTKVPVNYDPKLHLSSAMRAYRNPKQAQWVAHLLAGDIDQASGLAQTMSEPPALITRDLSQAKAWLERKRESGRSVGLLQSSGAVRLLAEGLPVPPRSNDLSAIAKWFLCSADDYRSSGALELPLSEFCCQGLELDYVGVCWDGDLLWKDGWQPRTMSAPKWRTIKSETKRQFRINGYRVLLTRARLGNVIYVPAGNSKDSTRDPAHFDQVADLLVRAGCQHL